MAANKDRSLVARYRGRRSLEASGFHPKIKPDKQRACFWLKIANQILLALFLVSSQITLLHERHQFSNRSLSRGHRPRRKTCLLAIAGGRRRWQTRGHQEP